MGGVPMRPAFSAMIAAAFMLSACSSKPREFNPVLGPASAAQTGFQESYATCQQLFVTGQLDSSGRLASAGAGAAAGAGMMVGGAAAATSAGLYTGAAIASATVVLIPFVALGSAFWLAKSKQKKKEKAIQTAMNGCLHERGYEVVGWERAPKSSTVKKAATVKEPAAVKEAASAKEAATAN